MTKAAVKKALQRSRLHRQTEESLGAPELWLEKMPWVIFTMDAQNQYKNRKRLLKIAGPSAGKVLRRLDHQYGRLKTGRGKSLESKSESELALEGAPAVTGSATENLEQTDFALSLLKDDKKARAVAAKQGVPLGRLLSGMREFLDKARDGG